jgi:phosphoribosyl 1,2-cyclic phosphodiesterase
VRVKLWGTRGSIATPGPETMRYGGNTSCVEVRSRAGTVVVLDAGTGILPLGRAMEPVERLDILLTHLHMDHIQGLGFFEPLFRPELDVHVWGPESATLDLRGRLERYLSPPLFPVHLSDFRCRLSLHDVVRLEGFQIGDLDISMARVLHPGPTVGYRIADGSSSLAYIPDHEPALGAGRIPEDARWISGIELAKGVDLLIHDAQYTEAEYAEHVGWGHSALGHVLQFAAAAKVKELVAFHHDPGRTDRMLDEIGASISARSDLPFRFSIAREGATYQLSGSVPSR